MSTIDTIGRAALLALALSMAGGGTAVAVDAFASPSLWVGSYGYDAGGWRVEQHPRLLGDVSGDRKLDIVGFGNAGAWVSRSLATWP
jgi:hypothetical protein